MDNEDQMSSDKGGDSPSLMFSLRYTNGFREEAKRGVVGTRPQSSPSRRLDACLADRTNIPSLNCQHVTPKRSVCHSRFRALGRSGLRRDVECQTLYSFPVDFDITLFFGSPLFLQLTDETDLAYLISTKANVSASSTELRQQLYKDGSDISAVVEDGDASWNSMLGAEMDRNEFSMDSFLHDDRSSKLRMDIDNATSEICFLSDGESEYESIIRSCWSSVEHPLSPALSPVEETSDDSFHSFKNDSERNDLEEHFSREGLSLSPIPRVDEDFHFGKNGQQYKQMEKEKCSGLDLHEYLPSTSGEVQNPAVVNGGMSVLDVQQPLEVDNVNLSSVSIVDEYFKQMQVDGSA